MRTQTVLLTHRCNQRCAFCDRLSSAPDPSAEAVDAAVREAVGLGAGRIVMSGGEPLLRADLEARVRAARALGVKDVVLHTNATGIRDAAHARALADAGVTEARVSVVTTQPDAHRSLVSPTTTPRHVVRGLSLLVDAGIRVAVRLPVAAGLPAAAGRLEGLSRALPAVRAWELAVVGRGARSLRAAQGLSREAVAEELALAFKVASRLDLRLTLAEDHPLPPCSVELPGEAKRLFEGALTRERPDANTASPACASCALATRCRAGADELRLALGDDAPRPIADAAPYLRPGKNPGTRLRVLREEDVEQFFHVDYDYGDVEVARPTTRLGIVYRCNQVCTFCELADMDVDIPREKVLEAIDKARARGSRRLIVTGGEPTLSPLLGDYVTYARAAGFEEIELQTNAVLLDKPGAARALREKGLTSAQVSLHGPDPAVSDRLTAAPGTHKRTLAGVTALLEAGVSVLLNHLIFKDNAHLLDDFVALCEARWGAHKERVTVQFHSPRNEFPDRASGLAHVPRYSEYADGLRRAIDRARRFGFHTHDLQDPTGIPALCVLGADATYLGPIVEQARRPRFHKWESSWLARPAACERCDLRDACMGVPAYYLSLHGEDEFKPFEGTPFARGQA